MNILREVVAAFLEAIRPLIIGATDPFGRDVLAQAFQLPPTEAASWQQIDVTATVARIESYLTNPDPTPEDFVVIVDDIVGITDYLRTFVNGLSVADPAAALEAGFSALTIAWLRAHQPIVYCLARMLGIIEWTLTPEWSERLRVERIGRLITDAHEYFRTVYPLKTEADARQSSDTLFLPLAAIAAYLGQLMARRGANALQPLYGSPGPETPGAAVAEGIARRTLTFALAAKRESTGVHTSAVVTAALVPEVHGGPGLVLRFGGADIQAPLRKGWTISARVDSEVALLWKFGDKIDVVGPANATAAITLSRTPDPARPRIVLPIAADIRAEIGDFELQLTASTREIDAKATIRDAALIVGRESSDSFSGSKMPASGVRGDFDLIVGISSVRGVYLGGTAGISATIPINKDLGPLRVGTLTIDVRPDPQTSAIRASAGLSLTLTLGPVVAVVDGIGMRVDVSFPAAGANLGVVDFLPAFQWPRGIGVTIDAGAVTGGGYIYFDPDNGRYAGVLQLDMKGFSIKAIGLLDTKLPGGEKGFSFLIIVAAEFSPIALGMGFTLNGVGGLAGIHRTIAIEPLQSGVRNHSVDDILFPEDPVKNAPAIISDLQRFFPPQKAHYVFGPMALIGWGSPTLLTVELGIIIELPAPLRIVLLGQLDCALPTPSSAIIELHVDILGVLDFGAKLFALDGVIHDSRLGPFSLYGDFAVRLRWGQTSMFVLSIGGLHPRFPAPAEFPSLRRITLALSNGDNPRLTMQCYFAITSNSLQFGARADLYASAGKFNVSGWIGFDVLLIFRPFFLRADLSAGFALRRGSRYLAGIHVEATLTGPAPWHVWGEATLTILCWDVSVGFDLTIGSAPAVALPSTDIWTSLRPAIENGDNWSAVYPPAAARVVTLIEPEGATLRLFDPVGNITLTERTAPLNRINTKFAEAVPVGTRRFDLDSVSIDIPPTGTVPLSFNGWSLVHELFPPAQVEMLSDDEKLSRPSFEKMVAGMSLPELVTFGTPIGAQPAYRTVIIDSAIESHDGLSYHLSAPVQDAMARVGAAALNGMHKKGSDKYVEPAPPKVILVDETYVIASADDLARRADLAQPGTKGDVLASLADHVAAHPEDREKLIVVAEEEAA